MFDYGLLGNLEADMSQQDHENTAAEQHRQRRRRLLATLGAGVASAYVAPTLLSVGQAHAWGGGHRSRPSHSRPSWSRPSHSRPSRYDEGYRKGKRGHHHHHRDDGHYRNGGRYHSHRQYEQDRRRLREYREDPLTIVEDIVFGRPDYRR